MSHPPPPLHFRTAVILGCIAMLVGVAGIFYFQRADESRRDTPATDACVVLVHGLPSVEGIRLRVRWKDLRGGDQEETGKPEGEAGRWIFQRAPPGVPVTLEVLEHAGGTKRTLHAMPAVLSREGLFQAWMPGDR
ncbi:MAG: hypothetical protein P1V36_01370 [Planctomycetota bacterium]|nr:hypothetical protein [Planctomycetota bacterium]